MTAQVADEVEVDGSQYAVAGVSGVLFDPNDHGVEPRPISTGCWRGYHCRYAVVAETLRLRELRLGAGSLVGGAEVAPGTMLLGAAGETGPDDYLGGYLFRWESFVVPFSGTLLVGSGFVSSTYVHMGYMPTWRFERVLELVVREGEVTAVDDRSAEMARQREAIQAGAAADPDGDRSDVAAWVKRTFTLGYDRTFGEPERPPGH